MVFLYEYISNQTSLLSEQELIEFIHYLLDNFVIIHQRYLFHVNLKLENVFIQSNTPGLAYYTLFRSQNLSETISYVIDILYHGYMKRND
jgi:serine/threonine protein kinase